MAKDEERAPFKERFAQLVAEYRAPKEQVNEFGGFKYRSAEQMIDGLKPLALKHGILFGATERIVGGDSNGAPGRVYVEVIVTAEDVYGIEERRASAWARETAQKRGMDEAQVSGSALSYALKYALGLLLMVGTEADPDADGAPPKPAAQPMTAADALQVYRVSWTGYKQRTGKDKDAIAADVAQAMGRTVDAASDVKTLLDAAAWLDAQGVANEG